MFSLKFITIYALYLCIECRAASQETGADPGFWNGGAQVERQRLEYRGATGAERVGFGERVSPSPIRVESGEGAVPPHRKFFNFLAQNSGFWRLF